MKNLLTLVGLKEENWKIKASRKSFLVIVLSTLYPFKKSWSNSITVTIQQLNKS